MLPRAGYLALAHALGSLASSLDVASARPRLAKHPPDPDTEAPVRERHMVARTVVQSARVLVARIGIRNHRY
jgi:hypothetical protein